MQREKLLGRKAFFKDFLRIKTLRINHGDYNKKNLFEHGICWIQRMVYALMIKFILSFVKEKITKIDVLHPPFSLKNVYKQSIEFKFNKM